VRSVESAARIEVSRAGTIQLDTGPAALLVDSSSSVAAGVRSAWQTDTTFIRFVSMLTWAARPTPPPEGTSGAPLVGR
jgi:hypothetical protein